MITTRPATLDDYPVILAFGERFHNSCPAKDWVPWDPNSLYRRLEKIRAHGALLVVEVDGELAGAAAAEYAPCMNNDAYLMGAETFWWVDPQHRRGGAGTALMDALEAAAKAAGCHVFSMMSFEGEHLELLNAVYRKRGYQPTERAYVKRL